MTPAHRRLGRLADRQVVAALRLRDHGTRGTIGPARSLCGERLEVLTRDGMQDRIFGRAGHAPLRRFR